MELAYFPRCATIPLRAHVGHGQIEEERGVTLHQINNLNWSAVAAWACGILQSNQRLCSCVARTETFWLLSPAVLNVCCPDLRKSILKVKFKFKTLVWSWLMRRFGFKCFHLARKIIREEFTFHCVMTKIRPCWIWLRLFNQPTKGPTWLPKY